MPENKRRFHRYAVRFPCLVKPAKAKRKPAGWQAKVETTDISRGGLYFVTAADLKVGTKIECVLELPIKAFGGRTACVRCRGKVARIVTTEQGGIGVGATIEHFEFSHLDNDTPSAGMTISA